MLTVITFLFSQPEDWKHKRLPYSARHVNALYRAVSANLTAPHRFICVTDQPDGIECETHPLWGPITVAGREACYRKVRAFHGTWQRSLGDRILCLDLDAVILGSLDPLITDDDFRILEGTRDHTGEMIARYNGSLWLCKSGARPHFWSLFDEETAAREIAAHVMPSGKRLTGSDQAWLSVVSPLERTYTTADGVYQYARIPHGTSPENARIVFFAGRRKPWGQTMARENPELHSTWLRYDRG